MTADSSSFSVNSRRLYTSAFILCTTLINATQVTLTSAPDAPGISSAIFLKLMPLVKFIFLEWILRMSRRAYTGPSHDSATPTGCTYILIGCRKLDFTINSPWS